MFGEFESNLDDCIDGGPPFQVLKEGGVVADSCMNLTEGNFQEEECTFYLCGLCV